MGYFTFSNVRNEDLILYTKDTYILCPKYTTFREDI